MKTFAKRISALFMAMMLVVTMIPAVAQAAVSAPTSTTVYLSGKTGSSYVNISVSGLTSKQSIAKSSVKSSKTSVLALDSITNGSSSSKTQYWNGGKTNSSSSRYVNINLMAKKAGTSTVSYKVGSKTYKTKVTVKSYVNPIKTLKISGVKNGSSTNLASKFKTSNRNNGKLSSSSSNGTVKVTAASGWKITYIDVYSEKTGIVRGLNAYGTPVSSATLYTGALKKGNNYSVYIGLKNTKTGGMQYVALSLS